MTDKQITRYEYCKKYLSYLNKWKNELPFKIQQFGCGSGQPSIEYELEEIHNTMYNDIIDIIKEVIVEVEVKIEEI